MTQKSKNLTLIFVVKHRAAKAAADWQKKKNPQALLLWVSVSKQKSRGCLTVVADS